MKDKTNNRSIRIDDDIWNELLRLRLPRYGIGKQKTWNKLFNYFLILHHGNGDWRAKVKEVDKKMEEKMRKLLRGAYGNPKFDPEKIKMDGLYDALERQTYDEFVAKQTKELNK